MSAQYAKQVICCCCCGMIEGGRPATKGYVGMRRSFIGGKHGEAFRRGGAVSLTEPSTMCWTARLCDALTRGFSPPCYHMLLMGCRNPTAVQLAFTAVPFNRAHTVPFNRAHMTVWPMSLPTCTASSQCTDGLRVRVDPGWSACPLTRPSGHTLGITMWIANRDSRGDIRRPRPETFTPLPLNAP
jgi:hypothetical protein